MKFILRSRDISEDNEFALIQSRKWLAWRFPATEFVIKYADEEYPGINSGFEYCPVGSLEFCLANLPGRLKPVNVPAALSDYDNAGRIIMTSEDMLKASAKDDLRSVYVKSADTFKHRANGFYKAAEVIRDQGTLFGNDNIQITTDINQPKMREGNTISDRRKIVSEWRCFVFKKELVGIKHYCGRAFSVPNEDKIKAMIAAFTDSPIAYTLDVVVVEVSGCASDKTYIMEAHDFFGCGLYGFDRPDLYPYMCHQWFSEWKRKNGIL